MKVTVDVRGLDSLKRNLALMSDDIKVQALSAAINKVAQKANTEINRAITEEYAVKASEVRNAITLRRANRGNLEAVLSIFGSASKRGRSANMIRFLAVAQLAGIATKVGRPAGVKRKDVKAIGKQLGFLIKKGGGLKQIEGAFVGNKGRTVFIRTGKDRRPIKPVQVIGFSQMFSSKKISDRVMAKVNADFDIEIERALKMVLAKRFG